MKKILFVLFVAVTSLKMLAQCPTLTVAPASFSVNCPGPYTSFTATPSYTANITSRWLGNNNIPLVSTVSTSINSYKDIFLPGAPGTYTVEFKDNSSNCIVTQTVLVNSISAYPAFSFVAQSFTQNCTNSSLPFSATNVVTNPIGSPVGYAFGTFTTPINYTGSFGYTVNSCGNYYVAVKDFNNACETSYSFAVSCGTLSPSPIIINGTNSVCIGSSTTFSASGANTYTWSNASNSPSINITPSVTTNYSVAGTNSVGCITNSIVAVTVNTTCAQVWPGDANSDGVVDNTDVFELGLWSLNTGPARTFTSNAYTNQFANNWTGTVSTGKNKNHADCNGDGIINAADTLAIFNNFLQTHAFKSSNTFAVNADITIVPTQTLIGANYLSSADIYLGDAVNQINNVYGVAFDIQFDSTLLQSNSVYIVYTNSFLNAANTNINFKKTSFVNGKLYTTSVRTNGSNVSGNGKIATLFFKTAANYPANSILNFSVLNSKKITNAGILNPLSAGTSSIELANDVGVTETVKLQNQVLLFPNPAKENLFIQSSLNETIRVELMNVLGKSLLTTSFSNSDKIDLKAFDPGVYFVKISSANASFQKKIIIE